jgi:MraZ protein
VFTGEYRHTVDGKGRIAVPARYRTALGGGAYLTRWLDGCLAIFPRDAWGAIADKIAALPLSDADARTFSRIIFASAFEVEVDGQGRVLLPANLRAAAQLESNAVVVGARDHLELWSPERWAAYSAEMDRPEVLAQHLQGLGI